MTALYDPDGPVCAATMWPSNADLILACHRMGYLLDSDLVLDPTYALGSWWKLWRPEHLQAHHRAVDGTDFRALHYEAASFDSIAYDPPYVCPGGRKTSTIKATHARYGQDEQASLLEPDATGELVPDPMFANPAELQEIINDGLTEMRRLVKPRQTRKRGGIVLVKCMNYVWSGELWAGAEKTLRHAESLGFDLVARLEKIKLSLGPQPTVNRDGSPRVQKSPRGNTSTLFVLRAPK